jgi:hypothetical protein
MSFRRLSTSNDQGGIDYFRQHKEEAILAATEPDSIVGPSFNGNLSINFDEDLPLHTTAVELMTNRASLTHITLKNPLTEFQDVYVPSQMEAMPTGTLSGSPYLSERVDDGHAKHVWASAWYPSTKEYGEFDCGFIFSERRDHYIAVILASNPAYEQFSQHLFAGGSTVHRRSRTYVKSILPVTVSFWFKGVWIDDEPEATYTLHWSNPIHNQI